MIDCLPDLPDDLAERIIDTLDADDDGDVDQYDVLLHLLTLAVHLFKRWKKRRAIRKRRSRA